MRLLREFFARPPSRVSRIIVGLGNPGSEYANTRHNVGFRCVNRIARDHDIRFSIKKRRAHTGVGEVEGQQVALVKPRTYMNNSGDGVRYLLERFSADPSDLVVIYDDMDLPVGSVRIRAGGGAGGHKGIGSIIQATGTQGIARIRVGIGRPQPGMDSIEHVLTPFLPEEEVRINDAMTHVAEAVAFLMREGVEAAMGRFNNREGE
jgi:PTH1 family peptidyl-tRNA hydrolase